jgi:N-acetylglucosamine kinase-like BadF-type ATPase
MTLVGVDAGGSGSRAVVVRGGDVVERVDLGPLNLILHADAVDRLAGLLARTGAEAAGLGLAGLRSAADAEQVAVELTARTGARVAVGDDTDAALAGAFRGGPGVVVIAGTGSGAAGRDATGREARVGGHGFLLGDEGSGYWIGREAVRAALRAADGTGPPTALRDAVGVAFGHLLAAERQVHERPTDRQLLARLVPVVAAAAAGQPPARALGHGSPDATAGGDAEARRILAEAAGHLVDLAEAVRARLGPLPVAGVGGIFRCAPVRYAFTAATGAVDPAEPPELGALRLLDR